MGKYLVFIFLFTIVVLISVAQAIVTYTPSSENTCDNGLCTMTIYSGTQFIYEDSKWKKVEDARSLKSVWQKVYLEKDPNYDIEFTDYNYTYISGILKVNSKASHPFEFCFRNETASITSASSKGTQVYCRSINITFADNPYTFNIDFSKSNAKVNIAGIDYDAKAAFPDFSALNPLDIVSWKLGANSTKIFLNESNYATLEDIYVRSDQPNTNKEGDSDLVVQGDTSNTGRVFLMFNLTLIPSGATIDYANLSLYCKQVSGAGARTYQAYNTSTYNSSGKVWDENVMTWNNQQAADTLQSTYITVPAVKWYSWNVTNAVQASLPIINVSLMIKDSVEDSVPSVYSIFRSKGYATVAQRPQLIVTYTTPSGLLPHIMDIGDPLYCSIPSITGKNNTEIMCMPKSNITGQALTGLTVVCQANAQGLYTGGVQAASACGERSYGVYNWTFLGSNMAAGGSYTINCSTAIGTTVNGFAASIYIMPTFAQSQTVTALTANITSVNNTVKAVGSNTSFLQTEILQVGSNLTSVNTTMNAQYGKTSQNLTLIQGNLSAMITAASSAYFNLTAVNNSLAALMTASYSDFLNTTAMNNSMTAYYNALANNLTNHNTTMVAEFNAIGTNLTNMNISIMATNNSLAAFYGNLASNLTTLQFEILQVGSNITNVNTTMVAKFLEVIEDLFYIQGNVTAVNNSLQELMTASYSNFANTTAINNSLGTFITASYSDWLNLTSHNTTMTTQYGKVSENLTLVLGNLSALDIGKLAQNLTNINSTLVATNNSLQVLMTASNSNFLNNTAMNNSLASFYGKLSENMTLILGNMSALDMGALSTNITSVNNTVKAVGSNLTQINITIAATNNSLSTLMTASYSNFANTTALNYSLTSYYNSIGKNLTDMNITIKATNNSLATFYGKLAENNTLILGNLSALDIGKLAQNLTNINSTLVATNNSIQVLMTASYSNFANNTATNNSLASFYGKTSQNITLILGNLSALNIDAIAQNLTDINMTLIATNNSLTAYYNALANNLTSVNNTIIIVGYNVTSVNNTVIAVGANLTTYYHAIAANMTSFNTTSYALLAQLGINITSVNNTVIIVGSNLTTNMTRLYNILAAIAMCIPCPIGGLVGGGGSNTIPSPMGFAPQNVSISIPQAPATNLIAGVAGFLLLLCGGMYYKLRNEKKKVKKAKGIIASKDEEEKKKRKT